MLDEIDEPETFNELAGPSQAPNQRVKVFDFSKNRVPKELEKSVRKNKLKALKA